MAISVPPVRPNHGGAILVTSGDGTVGADGSNYVIKASRFYIRSRTRLEDITGDTDVAPVQQDNGFQYSDFLLDGQLVAGETVGLQHLAAGRTGGTGAPVAEMEVQLGAGHQYPSRPVMMETIETSWSKDSATIAVRMRGRFTDEHLTETVS